MSHTSSSKTSSSRADAAAKVAGLKAKLQFLDLEAKTKAELERVQTMMQLTVAEAEHQAYMYAERNDDMHEDIPVPVVDKTEFVDTFVKSTLTPDLQHAKTVPDTCTPTNFAGATQPTFKYSELTPQETSTPAWAQLENRMMSDMANISRNFAEQINMTRLPMPEPDIFQGDPLKYPTWARAFETLIVHQTIPSSERIHYLQRYVGGEAKTAIEGCFLLEGSEAYEEARRILKHRYGDQFLVANSFRDKLDSWPQILAKDATGLRKFSDFLQQVKIAMRANRCLAVLDDMRENRKVLARLPDWIVTRWARVVSDWKVHYNTYPPFEDFARFIEKEADIACDPVTSLQSLRGVTTKRGARSLATETNPSGDMKENPKARTCTLCHGEHHLNDCKIFLSKDLEQRKQYAREKGLCFACLIPAHRARSCRRKMTCSICQKQHPSSLHEDRRPRVSNEGQTEVKSTSSHTTVSHLSDSGDCSKGSMIVPVWLSSESSTTERLVYAMLDTQSDTTFVLGKTCDYIGVEGPDVNLSLSTMACEDKLIKSKKICGLTVRGYDSSVNVKLPAAYTRDIMPVNRSHIPTPEMANQWPHLKKIAKELIPVQDCEVGLLIGYNCPIALTPREVIPPVQNGPFAQRTDLGWGIVGIVNPVSIEGDNIGVSHRVVACEVPQSLRSPDKPSGLIAVALETRIKEVISPLAVTQMMAHDFSEYQDDTAVLSQNDQRFLTIMRDSIRMDKDGHYEMPLPFKGEQSMQNNRSVATHRLKHLKARLQKDPKYRTDYTSFMEEVLQKGYAEKVPESELDPNEGQVWYMPHHGVYHPKKPEKIRVVFDCSARFKGESLNDKLLQGPDLTNTLLGVLCRFRQEKIAIMCDIEKMFFQFRVKQQHRDFLRFLWWEDGDSDTEPVEYRMKVHLFGAASSPGCANFGLKQTATDFEGQCGSEAADFIRHDFYVDDGLKSVPSVDDAKTLIAGTKDMCARGGLRLHKFTSNSKEVINSIPVEDRATGIKELDLHPDVLPVERALGVHWCITSDELQFRITLQDRPATRRGILSTVCSVYDPLGFLAPVMLEGKQILQEMCRDQADWDSPLSEELKPRWEKWRSSLHVLETVKIPRCYKPEHFGPVTKVQLHHFSDASTDGYGQCSYLRLIDDQGHVHCALVMGKARVTPLKVVTIPRLELTAAVMSVRVNTFLQNELQCKIDTTVYWTDSRIVLGYISNDARRFHVFVANRVQQIRDKTEPAQWRYVKSEDNPADQASRGLGAETFVNDSCWLTGPSFLWKKEIPEDEQGEGSSLDQNDPEVRATVHTAKTEPEKLPDLLSRLKYFSDWHRARRAIALCLRLKKKLQMKTVVFPKQVKTRRQKSRKDYVPVDTQEMQDAETAIMREVQRCAFPKEREILTRAGAYPEERQTVKQRKDIIRHSSSLFRLDPFIDSNGLIRVGGRVRRANVPHELAHPVILPKDDHVTTLLIRHFHERTRHSGTNTTLSEIRASGYWVVKGRSTVAGHVWKCVTCRKLRGRPSKQKMADLPPERVEPSAPFTASGVDFFGPFLVKEGRSMKKRWGALFTCLVSRAVHIEVAHSLTTDSFLNAYRRFVSRRGPVRLLRCDRGTNFVGAKGELEKALHEMSNDKIQRELLKDQCDWVKFDMNVPHASHMGGVWERMIRSVRAVLSALLDQHGSQLDDELLHTLMVEAEAVVNSRPITYPDMTSPDSTEPLSPSQLLTLKTKVILPPPGHFVKEDVYCRMRWRRVQFLVNQFWNRWRKEYLQILQERQKWNRPERNLEIGDIVLMMDENVPRCEWPRAIVTETYPSQDSCVRKVKLKTATSNFERPVHKLVSIYRPGNPVEEPQT